MKTVDQVTLTGRITATLRDAKTGRIIKVIRKDNIIVTTGKNAVAARLAGDTAVANRGEITFGAVGTGTTAPTVGDTTLETEFFRKVLALRQSLGNVTTLQLFLNTSEGNTTLTEFGLFGEDASATPDSGTMFNRVNINIVKTASNTLTIEVEITVN